MVRRTCDFNTDPRIKRVCAAVPVLGNNIHFNPDPRIRRVNLLNNNFSLAGFQYRPACEAGQGYSPEELERLLFQYRPARKAGQRNYTIPIPYSFADSTKIK